MTGSRKKMNNDAVDAVVAEYYLHVEETGDSAGDMAGIKPERDLWPGIEARLSSRTVLLDNARSRRFGVTSMTRARSWVPMLVAASLLVIATVAVTSRRILLRESRAENAQHRALDTVARHSVVQLVDVQDPALTSDVETAYDQKIAELKTALDQRRNQLDTATVRIIEDNLRVIDKAVRESRAALAKDPNSSFLAERLESALATKVRLLHTASLLLSTT